MPQAYFYKYLLFFCLEIRSIYYLRVGAFCCSEDEGYILAGWYYMNDILLATSFIYKYPAVSIMNMTGCL